MEYLPASLVKLLQENDIVNDEDQEKILSEKTRKAQVRSLLDTIPLRGPKAYSVFIDSLREKYSWLVEELESKANSDKTDFSETNHLNDILLKGGVPHAPSCSITRLKEVRLGHPKHESSNTFPACRHQAGPVPADPREVPHPPRDARLREVGPGGGVRPRPRSDAESVPRGRILVQGRDG